MRLIDADALIELLNKYKFGIVQKEVEREYIKEVILRFVEEQPTAYSVEKVVEELEQQAEQYKRRALELVEKSTEAGIHNKGKSLSYEHAIEIVRNGGKE